MSASCAPSTMPWTPAAGRRARGRRAAIAEPLAAAAAASPSALPARQALSPPTPPPCTHHARLPQQAAKLADAVLKKYKGDQLTRALRGYALHRSGRADEALQVRRGPSGCGVCTQLGCRPVVHHAGLAAPRWAAPYLPRGAPHLLPTDPPRHSRPQLMRELTSEGPRSERVAMTMAYTLKAAGDIAGITQVLPPAAW